MTEFKVSSLIRQYRGLILLSALTSVMFSSLALTMPMMLKVVIDRVLPSRDWALFFLLAAVMIAIYILRFTMRIITGNLGTYTVTRILLDVRQRIFKHLQNLSLRFYEDIPHWKTDFKRHQRCGAAPGADFSLHQHGGPVFHDGIHYLCGVFH